MIFSSPVGATVREIKNLQAESERLSQTANSKTARNLNTRFIRNDTEPKTAAPSVARRNISNVFVNHNKIAKNQEFNEAFNTRVQLAQKEAMRRYFS